MEVYQKLQEIRKRPGMYLGRNSLELLKSYMDGYMQAYQDIGSNIDLSFFTEFQKYIQEYYNVLTSHNWANIIRFYSTDDRDALELFFVHVDKFNEEYKKI